MAALPEFDAVAEARLQEMELRLGKAKQVCTLLQRKEEVDPELLTAAGFGPGARCNKVTAAIQKMKLVIGGLLERKRQTREALISAGKKVPKKEKKLPKKILLRKQAEAAARGEALPDPAPKKKAPAAPAPVEDSGDDDKPMGKIVPETPWSDEESD